MIRGKALCGLLALALAWSFGLGAATAAAAGPAVPAMDTQPAALPGPDLAARMVADLGAQTAEILASPRASEPEWRRAALRDVVRQGFDLEATSQFVLGKSWGRATEKQKSDFLELFTEYLLNSYARHLAAFSAETLRVVDSHPAGERDILVQTSVDGVDGPVAPVWRVRPSGGQYMVVDVAVDGVSLALTQRREFASVVNRIGLDGLIEELRQKLASQAKTTFRQMQPGMHASFLASILASPNASRLDLFVAGK